MMDYVKRSKREIELPKHRCKFYRAKNGKHLVGIYCACGWEPAENAPDPDDEMAMHLALTKAAGT